MSLNNKEKRHLRQQAHSLKPVIIIGNKGFTTAVQQEIEVALEAHELIKIKVNDHDKAQIKMMLPEICTATAAEPIQIIGHIITIWRKRKN